MNVELIANTNNPIDVIYNAARTCYSKKIKDVPDTVKEEFIQTIIETGHHSVLEHVSFTFSIKGVSRALLAQLTRHRFFSFSVASQRYINHENFEYVTPASILTDEALLSDYHSLMRNINSFYKKAMKIIPKEDARFILPNATTTDLIATVNLRELIHFCNLRLCIKAQWEIRDMAKAMKFEVNSVSEFLASTLNPNCANNGKCKEKIKCGKIIF
jgi:thymidylate synthase (FAD)